MSKWLAALLLVLVVALGPGDAQAANVVYSAERLPAANCSNQDAFSYSSSSLEVLAGAMATWATAANCVVDGNMLSYSVASTNLTSGLMVFNCAGVPNCGWSATATMRNSCPAKGTVYSSGRFDYGADAGTGPRSAGCTADGCMVSFSGDSPTGRALVGGVYHYFATGGYDYLGSDATCTSAPENSVSTAQTALPAASCSGTDVPTTINGQIKCVVQSTGAPSVNSPPDATQKSVTTTTDNADGSKTITETTTYADGSKSVKIETLNAPSSGGGSSVETQIQGGPGTQAAQANPGAVPGGVPSGTGTGGNSSVEFPSDYARAGEAQSAANSINDALGPKLDKLAEMGADPTDPTLPQGSEFDQAFFQNTFTALTSWQLPAHSSQCPTASFNFNSTNYAIDSHCQLVADHFNALAAVMAVVWTMLALFILLGA